MPRTVPCRHLFLAETGGPIDVEGRCHGGYLALEIGASHADVILDRSHGIGIDIDVVGNQRGDTGIDEGIEICVAVRTW